MTSEETIISIETPRVPSVRQSYGSLAGLAESLAEGQRHPIAVWKDGTLISGARRLRTHFLMSERDKGYRTIRAVFVDNIEDAAARLMVDVQDDHLAMPMKPSEICELWVVLRKLDEPARILRTYNARKRGAELRKQAMAGVREPGRAIRAKEDYFLSVLGKPFGYSVATAIRLWRIYTLATSLETDPQRRKLAQEALNLLDEGTGTIAGHYVRVVAEKAIPYLPRQAARPVESAPAPRQLAALARTVPQLQGMVDGLIGLGPINPDLTWEQIAPSYAQLRGIRRSLENLIHQMKGRAQS